MRTDSGLRRGHGGRQPLRPDAGQGHRLRPGPGDRAAPAARRRSRDTVTLGRDRPTPASCARCWPTRRWSPGDLDTGLVEREAGRRWSPRGRARTRCTRRRRCAAAARARARRRRRTRGTCPTAGGSAAPRLDGLAPRRPGHDAGRRPRLRGAAAGDRGRRRRRPARAAGRAASRRTARSAGHRSTAVTPLRRPPRTATLARPGRRRLARARRTTRSTAALRGRRRARRGRAGRADARHRHRGQGRRRATRSPRARACWSSRR